MTDDRSERRGTLDERVSWTTGFTTPADKAVLAAIAFWADFESGRNSRPGMERLVAKADLPKRTVERSLRRLINEGWIKPQRQHRGYTTYTIVLERLATSRADARLLVNRAVDRGRRCLSANMADKTEDRLSANLAGQSANVADLVRQCGGRTNDQYLGSVPKCTGASAPASAAAIDNASAADRGAVVNGGDDGLAATEGAALAARGADVSADAGDRASDDDRRRLRELDRDDQAAPRHARIPLPDRSDPSGDRRADGSGAQPIQQSFGPLALDPAQRRAALVTLGDVWRASLKPRRAASS